MIIRRMSGSACRRMRFTTFAGISSTRSTASSTYSSSTTSLSSVSEKPRMSSSCCSGCISTNVSAASSFGNSRKRSGRASSSVSSKTAATSAGFIVTRMSRSAAYFFPSISAESVLSRVTVVSAIGSYLLGYLWGAKTQEGGLCAGGHRCRRCFHRQSTLACAAGTVTGFHDLHLT